MHLGPAAAPVRRFVWRVRRERTLDEAPRRFSAPQQWRRGVLVATDGGVVV